MNARSRFGQGTRFALAVVAGLVSLGAGSSSARADEPSSSAADASARAAELKKRGDTALEGGYAADAYAAYVEAYGLSKDPALLFNKGRALQALGDFPAALAELEAFDKTAPPELKARVPGLAKIIGDLRARVTMLTVACDTMSARVALRDKTLGTCPLPESVTVLSGRAKLDVTADGYFTYSKEIELPPGGRATVDVRLQARATTGVLRVTSPVPNALVAVDGATVGVVPVETFVQPGAHTVEVKRDGYQTASSRTIVAAGQSRELDLPLDAEGGLLTKWWFWTGIGVLAAGGVAIAVAAGSEKDPEPGTLPPGVVSGGLTSAVAPGFRF